MPIRILRIKKPSYRHLYRVVVGLTATRNFLVGADAARNPIKHVRLQAPDLCSGIETWASNMGEVSADTGRETLGIPSSTFSLRFLGGMHDILPLRLGHQRHKASLTRLDARNLSPIPLLVTLPSSYHAFRPLSTVHRFAGYLQAWGS
jgi:hypothetical protein